ncbi:hypothetical protein Golomagni_06346 [Golovinomyces magnicellulatus]|nr:hypothetical protein Golomagni_06346 [Golovinomyces magnicellulatus]
MGATDPTPESVEKKDVEVKVQDTAAKAAEVTEDVPDPDEDDLDDLDDMLDEFSAVKLDQNKAAPSVPAAAPAAPAAATSEPSKDAAAPPQPDANLSEEDFAKQLQAGMADLLGELENSPQMQQEFEQMFKQMTAGAEGEAGAAPAAGAIPDAAKGAGDAAAADASFQDTIRKTMERMQNSGEQATAAASSGGNDDFMSELLKQMAAGDMGGEGGEEEFSKMLMGMMEQLTNKEILYEPMKELNDKFPEWMEKNKDKTSAEDMKRYEEQKVLVGEMVAKFEAPTYSDSNSADREYIVERMQKMQEAGSPPSDLVGDMASAQEAFTGGAEEQCNPQ